MKIHLIRAGLENAEEIWHMQIESFRELLDRYQDYHTNPGNEPLEKVWARLEQESTYYYFICLENGEKAGAIRIVDWKEPERKKRISPLFLLPIYQNRGFAQQAIRLCEKLHGKNGWELSTISQEKKNCHLYEKMGYHTTGLLEKINDRLTLVFYEK